MNIRKHIPNTITLLNQASGIVACLMVLNGNYLYAMAFVLLGALFDFFDGAAARLLRVSSPMGKELDSLADMITFGLTSGLLAYKLMMPLADVCFVLPYSGFLITLFSALRLAKFNIDERQTSSFIGLATPANALFWFGLAVGYEPLLSQPSSPWVVLALTLLSSYLLVAELPMFSLKFHNFRWSENRVRFIFLIGVVAFVALFRLQSLSVIIIWYVLLSLVNHLFNKSK